MPRLAGALSLGLGQSLLYSCWALDFAALAE
jgi:hypothetical protein